MDLTGATWRKSSYSTSTNCVDVALVGVTWRKSSHNATDNWVKAALEGAVWSKASVSGNAGTCVEVARELLGEPGIVAIRDSRNPGRPSLIITATAWRRFTADLRNTGLGTILAG
jgi:Domain of unknown function (DUF397)